MSGLNNNKKNVFFCLKIIFTFTNSVDPDEMQHNAAFHQGLHCLQKYSFKGFSNTKGQFFACWVIASAFMSPQC